MALPWFRPSALLLLSGVMPAIAARSSAADGAPDRFFAEAPSPLVELRVEATESSALEDATAEAWRLPAALPRVTIANGSFVREGRLVLPLGGNYVLKARPYFPDVDVVTRNARELAAGLAKMPYSPSRGHVAVPVVRLGALMEGAMPHQPFVIDPIWAAMLETTVQAFADAGVYVLLDIHQDALATTNGGEGLPVWMTAKMQETAGVVPDCASCTSFDKYITTPELPLECALTGVIESLLKELGYTPPHPQVVAGDENPWLAYSVNSSAGDPSRMNVGNVNMRLNNNDDAWGQGILLVTHQVQNIAWRLYRSHRYPGEKEAFFDPFVSYVKYLCGVWERHSNVIALELLNEPPLGGFPDIFAARNNRNDLFNFYAAILGELDADPSVPKAPVALEDVTGNNGLISMPFDVLKKLGLVEEIYGPSVDVLRRWTEQGRLIVSFHWYPPNGDESKSSLRSWISSAMALSHKFGGPPLWLTEYYNPSAQGTANIMSLSAELGCDAVTYWHFVDTDYTASGGWYRGDAGVKGSVVDWEKWRAYEATVANGTYWGAGITGADGGKMDVLELVPQPPASIEPVSPSNELAWMGVGLSKL